MYVRLQSSYSIVSLPTNFLSLKKVDNDELTFELTYKFDQELAIKKNLTTVVVDIASESPPSLNAVSNTENSIKGILGFQSAHVKSLSDYIANSIVLSHTSDPTKKINNELVQLFNRGYTSEQLPQLKNNALVPIRTIDATSAITAVHAQHDMDLSNVTSRTLAERLLLQGVDPSSAYEINDLGLSLIESHSGIAKYSPVVFRTETEKDLYSYKTISYAKPILQTSAGEPGVVLSNESLIADQYTLERAAIDSRHVTVHDTLRFKLNKSAPDRMTLIIRVKDKTGVTVQSLERVFYPRDFIKYYMIPRARPIVKISNRSDKSYAMLNIRQVDIAASKVRIYKRIYDHNGMTDEPYTFVNEIDLTIKDGWKYLPVEVSYGNTIIYRIIPISPFGTSGSDYASIVLKPQGRNPNFKQVVITTKTQLKGVQLEVSKLPSDCVSFRVYRRDVTIGNNVREDIGSPILVNTSDPNVAYSVVDASVKANHVYAYYCRIFRKTGSQEDRLATHYEHIPLVENIVETKIIDPNLTLTDRGYDVHFKLSTTVVGTRIDQLKQLLEKQGFYDLFQDDIADVRDQLGKLIAHTVKRVDLMTGAVEDFGVVDKDEFSDLTARNVAGVSELRVGRKYRYVVTALLRAPETMLENFTKSVRDPNTKRLYNFNPFKFLHPIVAQHGNIVTVDSIRTNYVKEPMMFGEIGSYAFAEITVDRQKSLISSAVREKKGVNIDVLRWTAVGASKDVDHFQVILEHGGKRSIVGRATCAPDTDSFLYVRKLNQVEIGLDLRYYICPVYHDFVRGLETSVSNVEEGSW